MTALGTLSGLLLIRDGVAGPRAVVTDGMRNESRYGAIGPDGLVVGLWRRMVTGSSCRVVKGVASTAGVGAGASRTGRILEGGGEEAYSAVLGTRNEGRALGMAITEADEAEAGGEVSDDLAGRETKEGRIRASKSRPDPAGVSHLDLDLQTTRGIEKLTRWATRVVEREMVSWA